MNVGRPEEYQQAVEAFNKYAIIKNYNDLRIGLTIPLPMGKWLSTFLYLP